MTEPFLTIGHSDRDITEFTGMLRDNEIGIVFDVRKIPGSARHPQFNQDALAAALEEAGVAYRHEAGLTGRRNVSREVAPEVNGWWTNRSFHNYADHALTDEFRESLAILLATGAETRSAVMCSEAVWWRCHRRIIADHLLAHGEVVNHLISPGRVEPASLNEGAVVGDDHRVTYPASE